MTTMNNTKSELREYTTPSSWESVPESGVAEVLWRRTEERPGQETLAYRRGDQFVPVTLSEVQDRVESLAKGLIAAGVEQGDRVALFSPTRIEYTYVDLALWAVGAVVVTIYETSSAEQVEWIVADSGAKAIFIDGAQRHAVFAQRAGKFGTCGLVFDFDRLEELEKQGDRISDDELRRRRQAVTADDLATVIYTSGTTGRPKGVELTHHSLQWTLGQSLSGMDDIFRPGASTLLFLPLAHIFARLIQVAAIESGTLVNYSTGLPNLVEELALSRPTFIFAAPRVFEKMYNRARHKAHSEGKGRIFDLAADVAMRHSQGIDSGRHTFRNRVLHALFEPLVYKKIRAVLGGRVEYAISGSAPLGERLGHFYRGIGLQVLEGYGLTETAAGGAVNLIGATKIGTVGRPTPGATIRIGSDGEVLLKGGFVMRGYWNNPTATSETIDDQGWLHTGDLGALDGDGFLRITGRKKEILVTAGGKNVAPSVLEDRVSAHPLVGGCVVVGDGQPFISALIAIDPEEWETWAPEHGVAGEVANNTRNPILVDEIQLAISDANQAVSKAESIREFRILPTDFTIESGELTTTLKVRRNFVTDKYSHVIDEIYADT